MTAQPLLLWPLALQGRQQGRGSWKEGAAPGKRWTGLEAESGKTQDGAGLLQECVTMRGQEGTGGSRSLQGHPAALLKGNARVAIS